MIDVNQIRSLSDFQRNAKSHIKRLKRSGKPEVLTVNGEAAVIVQDASAYQGLLDSLDRAQAIAGIREGLEQTERGEGVSLKEFDSRIRRKFNLAPRSRQK